MSDFYKVKVNTHFTASHQLILPGGKREKLHRHRWQVSVAVSSEKLNRMGLVVDFNKLKNKINSITDKISGSKMLKDEFFETNNCSAENVARYIYSALKPELGGNLKLESVEVEEEPGCRAEFSEK